MIQSPYDPMIQFGCSALAFEELDGAFVFFCGGARIECAEIFSLAGLGIYLA